MRQVQAIEQVSPKSARRDLAGQIPRSGGDHLDVEPTHLRRSHPLRLAALDREFVDPDWVRGAERAGPDVWQAKVRAGVWVLASELAGTSVVAGVSRGRIERAVVTDADLKSLTEIAEVTRALAARVRDGSITPPELSGGTFTVSNLGMYGITHFDAVINTPQAGILAVGAIEDRPVVREGQVVAAKMMSVTLSCDHRILYGAEGAEFLARIRAILEQPISLAM